MATDKQAADKLVFPRVVYRGEPDTLGTGQVGETKRVDSQGDLDAALKDGWRLTREDGKSTTVGGAVDPRAQTVDVLKKHIATVTDQAELDRLRAAEEAHPTFDGGRASVLKALDDREAELKAP